MEIPRSGYSTRVTWVVRKCIRCGDDLTVGVNWKASQRDQKHYKCISCHRQQINDYKKSHPGGIATRNKQHQTERARKANAVCKAHKECSFIDRRLVFLAHSGRCGICLKPIRARKWHLDHIMPLSRGGKHCYLNVQPSHVRCNLRKGNRIAL